MAVTGAGTASSPYILSEPADLDFIRTNLTSHFRLGNDIDMSSYGLFAPIGSNGTTFRFTGVLDGNGFKIKDLKISGQDPENRGYTGLFGSCFGTVKNLAIVNADVVGEGLYTGIVAGVLVGSGFIDQCYTSGKVTGSTYSGGIIGVTGTEVTNCFSLATLQAGNSAYGIGRIDSATKAKIENCLFYGTVPLTVTDEKGVSSTYRMDRVINAYYDATLNPYFVKVGIGVSTAQMQSGTSFKGFSPSIWSYGTGIYPYLTVLGEPEIIVPSKNVIVNVSSHLNIISSVLERSKRKVSINLTHVGNVTGQATRLPYVLKNVTSHIDEIVSTATAFKNANMKDYAVTSYIEDITGGANRTVKTIRLVTSYIKPFHIVSEIIIPVDVEQPVYANVYAIENPTAVTLKTNKSITQKVENATEMSVI